MDFALPPIPGSAALLRVGERVIVKNRPYISGSAPPKRVRLQQPPYFRRTFEQFYRETHEPRIFPIIAQRREPHLPVEAGLIRGHPPRRAPHVAHLIWK